MIRKIAFIFHDNDYKSGATRSMLDVVEQLASRKKYKIYAIFTRSAGDGSAIKFVKKLKIPIILIKYDYLLYNPMNMSLKDKIILRLSYYRSFCATMFWIGPVLKKEGVELVYTNTSTLYQGAWLKKYFGFKHIWHFREYPEKGYSKTVFGGRKKFYRMAEHYCDKVVVISQWLKSVYKKGIKSEKIECLYDDIGKENIILKKQEHNGTNILIAGALIESKGQWDIIRAVEKLHKEGYKIELYIAGSCPSKYGERICNYIEKFQRKNFIHYLGVVKDMKKLREEMDIGVVCSRADAFGRTVIEGMLSRMIMIGANAGATTELIEDGKTGFLYEIGNIDQLAGILRGVINNEKDMDTIIKNAYRFSYGFTVGETTRKIEKIIDGVLMS